MWGAKTEPDPGPHPSRAARKGGRPHGKRGRGVGTLTRVLGVQSRKHLKSPILGLLRVRLDCFNTRNGSPVLI